jgi:hypothetical protein
MSISSGSGVNPGNNYRVAWQRRRAVQNLQSLFSRDDAVLLARNANQMNPDVPHWVERWDANRGGFLQDEEASLEARGRARNSCLVSDLCRWFASLLSFGNDQPAGENRVGSNPPRPQPEPIERLSQELANKDALVPEDQARLFFPVEKSDRDEAEKLFAAYPLIAQDLWQRYRNAFQTEDTAQRLENVRKWAKEHLERKRNGQEWELRALEDSL